MRFRFRKYISFKLPAMIVVMVAVAVGVASVIAYYQQRQTLKLAAEQRIQGVVAEQAENFETLFNTIRKDLSITARRAGTKRAMIGFARSWNILDAAELAALRRGYVADNPYPAGDRQKLVVSGDTTTWSTVHAQQHPEFRDILALYGYGDIYLINADGQVLYSVAKWDDFGTDLKDAAMADTGLARVFEKAAELPAGEIAFEDFAAYAPAGNVRAAFLATPLVATNGEILGVLAYQILGDALTHIVTSAEGLGRSGDAYLVGPDQRARAIRRHGEGAGEPAAPMANPAVTRALEGQAGIALVTSADGDPAIAAFMPLDVFGQTWGIVAQQDKSEILASIARLRTLLLWGALAAILVVALLAVAYAQYLTRPLWRVVSAMREIARGNYAVDVPDSGRGDEIGAISRALENIRQKLDFGKRESRENTFRGVAFEATAAAVMMADADMTITKINPALAAILEEHRDEFEKLFPGFDPERTVGTEMDFYHPESMRERIREMLRDPENLPYSANISIADARFTLRISMVQEEDGTPMGYVVEWNDVTREFLNTAILAAIDNSQVKAEFTKDGIFMGANRKFVEMMGGHLERCENKHGAEIFRFSEALAAERGAVFDRLQSGETITGVFELPREEDVPAVVDGSFSPVLDANGRLLRILLLGNDVTEARRAIQAADERREAMRAAQSQVVDSLREGLGRLAEGDLTVKIEHEFSPEYEQLRADFNKTGERLLEAIKAVIDNADLIRGEASEIANAADDLSSRTERQAATLEETASALDQLTSSVRSAADGAGLASQLVEAARENAESSGAVVREAVAAMSAIEKSSQKISSITDVIDDIAFQTNLLALNAGVEAARAGDAGRGFAVVASEVRALAQRSSEAAREINALISESDSQVKRGVELVDQTGSALANIVENVSEINQKVGEIAVSAREQSSGLAEINEAMNQLDQVTQQNAAMFEQTTAASHALTREAEALTGTTSRFNVGISADRQAGASVVEMQPGAAEDAAPAAAPEPSRAAPSPPVSQGNAAVKQEPEIEEDWDDF